MKVLALVGAVIFATALMMGGAFLIVIQSPHRLPAIDLLAIIALTIFVYGPLLLGSLTTYWDVGASETGRRYFRRLLWVVLVLELLSAVAMFAYVALAPAALWLALLFIGGGAVLTLLGLTVGRALRRYAIAHPGAQRHFVGVTAQDIRKRILIVAAVFVIVVLIGMVVFLGLLADPTDGVAVEISFALQFAFLGAGMAALIVAFPLNRRLRETVGPDLGTVRRVSRQVLGGKEMQLDDGEQVAAAKYSMLVPTVLGFTLTYITLLYLALLIQQARLLGGSTHSHLSPVFTVGLTVVLVAFLVFFIPYYLIRIQRARRYAREHADLLSSGPRQGQAMPET